MKSVKLGEVAEINPRAQSVGANEDVSFVGLAELDAIAARAKPLGTRRFSEVSKGYTVFRNADILAAKITPSWENGKVGLAELDHPIGVGSTEFHVVRPSDALDRRYALHMLRQDKVRSAGAARMTGSAGQRRVPAAFLHDLIFSLPPLDEQRRIAAMLDAADAMRANRRALIAHFDTLTQAAFHDLFGGSSSPTSALGDLADITSGVTKGRKVKGPTVHVPYLAVSNVQAGALALDSVKMIPATAEEIDRFRLRDGDLVLTEGGDPDKLGRGTVWRNELPLAIHQNHIFRVRIRPDSTVRPEFASAYIGSPVGRAYFLRVAKQTTGIATINKSQLSEFPMLVPPLSDQNMFADRVAAIDRERRHVQRALAADNELFSSLQSRAFSGGL